MLEGTSDKDDEQTDKQYNDIQSEPQLQEQNKHYPVEDDSQSDANINLKVLDLEIETPEKQDFDANFVNLELAKESSLPFHGTELLIKEDVDRQDSLKADRVTIDNQIGQACEIQNSHRLHVEQEYFEKVTGHSHLQTEITEEEEQKSLNIIEQKLDQNTIDDQDPIRNQKGQQDQDGLHNIAEQFQQIENQLVQIDCLEDKLAQSAYAATQEIVETEEIINNNPLATKFMEECVPTKLIVQEDKTDKSHEDAIDQFQVSDHNIEANEEELPQPLQPCIEEVKEEGKYSPEEDLQMQITHISPPQLICIEEDQEEVIQDAIDELDEFDEFEDAQKAIVEEVPQKPILDEENDVTIGLNLKYIQDKLVEGDSDQFDQFEDAAITTQSQEFQLNQASQNQEAVSLAQTKDLDGETKQDILSDDEFEEPQSSNCEEQASIQKEIQDDENQFNLTGKSDQYISSLFGTFYQRKPPKYQQIDNEQLVNKFKAQQDLYTEEMRNKSFQSRQDQRGSDRIQSWLDYAPRQRLMQYYGFKDFKIGLKERVSDQTSRSYEGGPPSITTGTNQQKGLDQQFSFTNDELQDVSDTSFPSLQSIQSAPKEEIMKLSQQMSIDQYLDNLPDYSYLFNNPNEKRQFVK